MKAQTTLEFVLLLAAVASFSTVLLSIYSGFMHGQKEVLLGIDNSLAQEGSANTSFSVPSQKPYLAVLAQNRSYVGVESTVQAVLYVPEGSTVAMLELNATNAYVPQPIYRNVGSGTILESFEAMPLEDGPIRYNLTAMISDSGSTERMSAYAYAYATTSGQGTSNSSTQAFASIKRNSESVNYSVTGKSDIYTIGSWSHCSYVSFWGNELSLGQECGSSASWYLWVGSWYCTWAQGSQSDTMTYCFYKEPIGSAISHISQNASYSYNISLSVKLDSLELNASLSSSTNKSRLYGNGVPYGNATVTSVSGTLQDLGQSYFVLEKNQTGQESLINSSQYEPYYQALTSTVGMLDYYNGESASSSSLQYVLQSISSMDSDAEELSNATAAKVNGCSVSGNFVDCAPIPYLYYTISALAGNASPQSIDYEGSTISIS